MKSVTIYYTDGEVLNLEVKRIKRLRDGDYRIVTDRGVSYVNGQKTFCIDILKVEK